MKKIVLRNVRTFLGIFSMFFLISCIFDFRTRWIPEPKPVDGSIWYPEGDKAFTHRNLGLAGRSQVHIDVIINHAELFGYGIDKRYGLNDGREEYFIYTNRSWNEPVSWIFSIIVNPDGSVYSIDGDGLINFSELEYRFDLLYNYFCGYLKCNKVLVGRNLSSSEYVNSGPIDVRFPKGKEGSIRFRLGLAYAKSIRIEAVRSHAEALEYIVLDSNERKVKNERETVVIDTGLSLSGEFRQNYEIQIGENGWIHSIIEYRLKR